MLKNRYNSLHQTSQGSGRRFVALLCAAFMLFSSFDWTVWNRAIAEPSPEDMMTVPPETGDSQHPLLPECGLEEHVHTDACFGKALICGLEEGEDHQHTDDCYEEEEVLVCELEETEGHIHSDECYTETKELACGKPEHIHSSE